MASTPPESGSPQSFPSPRQLQSEAKQDSPNPYTLSPGRRTCPVPECPLARKSFRPQWRLTEHMKRQHGWPRKNKKPSLLSDIPNADSSLLTPPNSHDFSIDHDQISPHEPHVGGYSTRGAAQRRSARIDRRDSIDHAMEDVDEAPSPPTPPPPPPPRTDLLTSPGDPDLALMADIRAYITELRCPRPEPNPSDPPSPSLPFRPDDLAAGLQDALDRNLLNINSLLPVEQARLDVLFPLYKALAARAQRISAKQKTKYPFKHVSDFLPHPLGQPLTGGSPLPAKKPKTKKAGEATGDSAAVDASMTDPTAASVAIKDSPKPTGAIKISPKPAGSLSLLHTAIPATSVVHAKPTIKLKLNFSSG